MAKQTCVAHFSSEISGALSILSPHVIILIDRGWARGEFRLSNAYNKRPGTICFRRSDMRNGLGFLYDLSSNALFFFRERTEVTKRLNYLIAFRLPVENLRNISMFSCAQAEHQQQLRNDNERLITRKLFQKSLATTLSWRIPRWWNHVIFSTSSFVIWIHLGTAVSHALLLDLNGELRLINPERRCTCRKMKNWALNKFNGINLLSKELREMRFWLPKSWLLVLENHKNKSGNKLWDINLGLYLTATQRRIKDSSPSPFSHIFWERCGTHCQSIFFIALVYRQNKGRTF